MHCLLFPHPPTILVGHIPTIGKTAPFLYPSCTCMDVCPPKGVPKGITSTWILATPFQHNTIMYFTYSSASSSMQLTTGVFKMKTDPESDIVFCAHCKKNLKINCKMVKTIDRCKQNSEGCVCGKVVIYTSQPDWFNPESAQKEKQMEGGFYLSVQSCVLVSQWMPLKPGRHVQV